MRRAAGACWLDKMLACMAKLQLEFVPKRPSGSLFA
jgi:hypothetical protein